MSELGRAAYVLNMAVSYLSARGRAAPQELATGRLTALRGWLEETGAMAGEARSAVTTAYVDQAELPAEARLTAGDQVVIEKGVASVWSSLVPARQQTLVLRMAISHIVTDYGGSVPAGLVARTVEASAVKGAG